MASVVMYISKQYGDYERLYSYNHTEVALGVHPNRTPVFSDIRIAVYN